MHVKAGPFSHALFESLLDSTAPVIVQLLQTPLGLLAALPVHPQLGLQASQ